MSNTKLDYTEKECREKPTIPLLGCLFCENELECFPPKQKCSVCDNPSVKVWVNPSNLNDYAPYCQEHYEAISCAFENFKILVLAHRAGVTRYWK